MRQYALALCVAFSGPLVAAAQTPVTSASIQSLNDAVFVGPGRLAAAAPTASTIDLSATHIALTGAQPLAFRPGEGVDLSAGDVGIRLAPWAAAAPGPDRQASGLGASVRVQSADGALKDKLAALGVKDGASIYGDQGRFYLFAAVRGQAVGMNMQTAGGLHRTGWSTDTASALVGDGQVGVGWRKGEMEAAFGYVHRGIQIRNAPLGASNSYADDMAALSLTFHPHF
jgi:hypothetical protein